MDEKEQKKEQKRQSLTEKQILKTNLAGKGVKEQVKAMKELIAATQEATEAAKAQSDALFLSVIRKAAENGVWQAATWYLERSNPRFNKEVQKLQLEADLDELVEEIVVDFD